MTIVEKARAYWENYLSQADDVFGLASHVPEAEKWARQLLKRYPEADQEITLTAVWLHDIAHYDGEYGTYDHAINGGEKTKEFLLKENVVPDKVEAICHCVRSHRCKDVMPETLEAKIIACADSASHMTDSMYIDIVQQGKFEYVLGKIERDFRDLGIFPEIQAELKPIYESWKSLLRELISMERSHG